MKLNVHEKNKVNIFVHKMFNGQMFKLTSTET
uniref:Uncharacterized protein n=1 Tax=Anguilla anguilla TaxID=7936 RepID=A0A0E9SCU1_ANGAN